MVRAVGGRTGAKGGPETPVWPGSVVEHWQIGRLRENPNNPKLHTDAEVAEAAAAIKEWGWTIPILADEAGNILAGHKRYRAAKLMLLTEVPVIVARGWSDAKKRAYVIADNKLGEGGKWDDTLLALEVAVINEAEPNLVGLTGLSDADLKRLAGEDDDDRVIVQEIATTTVRDEFWISIRGPLKHQADTLQKLREVTSGMEGVSVDLGTIAVE